MVLSLLEIVQISCLYPETAVIYVVTWLVNLWIIYIPIRQINFPIHLTPKSIGPCLRSWWQCRLLRFRRRLVLTTFTAHQEHGNSKQMHQGNWLEQTSFSFGCY